MGTPETLIWREPPYWKYATSEGGERVSLLHGPIIAPNTRPEEPETLMGGTFVTEAHLSFNQPGAIGFYGLAFRVENVVRVEGVGFRV